MLFVTILCVPPSDLGFCESFPFLSEPLDWSELAIIQALASVFQELDMSAVTMM